MSMCFYFSVSVKFIGWEFTRFHLIYSFPGLGSDIRLWWNSWQKFKTLLPQQQHQKAIAENADSAGPRFTGGYCAKKCGPDYGISGLSSQAWAYFTVCFATDCKALSPSSPTTGIDDCWSVHEDKAGHETKVHVIN